jgi:HK97 family phage portal protein
MAPKFTLFPRRKALEARISELEGVLRLNENWDLKGQTLLDIIAENNGGTVTQKTAMKFTGVLAAVSLRSELLASFPKMIYEKVDSGRQEVYGDPLYKILAYQPNPYMNAFTFWELVNTHLDLWGNAYVYISRYGGQVRQLTPIDPTKVEIKIDGGVLRYVVKDTGDKVLDGSHSMDKFLHFKDISYDGIKGQSRISLANSAISIAQSAEAFGKEFFDKGGNSKAVIETDATMDDEAYTTFVKRWNQNADHGTPILDRGKKYKQLRIPMEDAQFISTREFQLQDIARVFRVPPHLLADLSRSTFSNVEHSDIQWVKYGLRPMVKRYEHELELKLLGDDLGRKMIRFNLDGILRGDTASRAAYLSAMKTSELYTTNELRVWNGDNKIDDPKADKLENPATTSNTKENGNND